MRTVSNAISSPCTDANNASAVELSQNGNGSALFTGADDGGDVARHARFKDFVTVCETVGLDELAARRIWSALQPIADDTALAGAAMGMSLDACEEAASAAVGDLIRAELAAVSR
jgi:hypothetical protein